MRHELGTDEFAQVWKHTKDGTTEHIFRPAFLFTIGPGTAHVTGGEELPGPPEWLVAGEQASALVCYAGGWSGLPRWDSEVEAGKEG